MKKVCVFCGNEFEAKLNRAKYCCGNCKEKDRQRRGGLARGIIKCLMCNTDFQPITIKQKFCSASCEAKYSHLHSIKEKERVCHCGNTYFSKRKDMLECPTCRNKRRNTRTMLARAAKNPLVRVGIGSGGGQHYRTEKPRHTKDIHMYRQLALNTYGYKCMLCDETDKDVIVVHHIDMDRLNSDIKNLAVLCSNCHVKIHRTIKQEFMKVTPSKEVAISVFNNLLTSRSKTAELSGENSTPLRESEPKAGRDSSQGQSIPVGEELPSTDTRPLQLEFNF